MSEVVISVRGLRKSYGETAAVADVSFEVMRGEVFALLGPNGSGKTTTLESLEGLRRPDAGALSVDGIDPSRQARRLRNTIGVQLQTSALPAAMTVEEALRFFRTRNFSPYSPPHSREIILATTSSAQEKSMDPVPEKSRTMRSAPFSSPKIFSRASRIRMPRDRPVISLDPFFKRVEVSFFKERVCFSILLLQLIQLNQLITNSTFCQVIFSPLLPLETVSQS